MLVYRADGRLFVGRSAPGATLLASLLALDAGGLGPLALHLLALHLHLLALDARLAPRLVQLAERALVGPGAARGDGGGHPAMLAERAPILLGPRSVVAWAPSARARIFSRRLLQ